MTFPLIFSKFAFLLPVRDDDDEYLEIHEHNDDVDVDDDDVDIDDDCVDDDNDQSQEDTHDHYDSNDGMDDDDVGSLVPPIDATVLMIMIMLTSITICT
jgi:hypothetical protein